MLDTYIRANFAGQHRLNAEAYAKAFFTVALQLRGNQMPQPDVLQNLRRTSECHVVGQTRGATDLVLEWVDTTERFASYLQVQAALAGPMDLRESPELECGLPPQKAALEIPSRPEPLDEPAPNVCPVRLAPARLVHVNGVATNFTSAQANTLQLMLTANQLLGNPSSRALFYTPPMAQLIHNPENFLGFLDLAESILQKVREADSAASVYTSARALFYSTLVTPTIAPAIRRIVAESIVTAARQQVADVERQLLLEFSRRAAQGKVLFVAHSQGNLYVDRAFQLWLSSPSAKYPDAFNLSYLGVASPSSTMTYASPYHPGLIERRSLSDAETKQLFARQYITADQDLVINLVRVLAPIVGLRQPIPANDNSSTNGEIDELIESGETGSHGFVETYLPSSAFRRRLLLAMKFSADLVADERTYPDRMVSLRSEISKAELSKLGPLPNQLVYYQLTPWFGHMSFSSCPDCPRMPPYSGLVPSGGAPVLGETPSSIVSEQRYQCREAVPRFAKLDQGYYRLVSGWFPSLGYDNVTPYSPFIGSGWYARACLLPFEPEGCKGDSSLTKLTWQLAVSNAYMDEYRRAVVLWTDQIRDISALATTR